MMAAAIVGEWGRVKPVGDLPAVQGYAAEFVRAVYGRGAQPDLARRFALREFGVPVKSGEFDALSYAFFRDAFESFPPQAGGREGGARRAFTQRVGARFFGALHDHLGLAIPVKVGSALELDQLKEAISRVGEFLVDQGYLRDQFEFKFEVSIAGVDQPESAFLEKLDENGVAHALYVMGYPAILPSAVILYQTVGEAQHHSSRTIEELFARAGLSARETDDFDPTGFPADRVVELWEVKRR